MATAPASTQRPCACCTLSSSATRCSCSRARVSGVDGMGDEKLGKTDEDDGGKALVGELVLPPLDGLCTSIG